VENDDDWEERVEEGGEDSIFLMLSTPFFTG
jgi:hypothetical protein